MDVCVDEEDGEHDAQYVQLLSATSLCQIMFFSVKSVAQVNTGRNSDQLLI